MLPHQERVVAERSELGIKLAKLVEFIGAGDKFLHLSVAEQARLRRQQAYMTAYLNVLDERIGAFAA